MDNETYTYKLLLANLLDCGIDDLEILTDMNFDYNNVIFNMKQSENELNLANIIHEVFFDIIYSIEENKNIDLSLNDYFEIYFNFYDTYYNVQYEKLKKVLNNDILLDEIIEEVENGVNRDLTRI